MMIKITINGKVSEVERGTSILNAAAALNIKIPTLCNHELLDLLTRLLAHTRSLAHSRSLDHSLPQTRALTCSRAHKVLLARAH
jgi:hypothetical protein